MSVETQTVIRCDAPDCHSNLRFPVDHAHTPPILPADSGWYSVILKASNHNPAMELDAWHVCPHHTINLAQRLLMALTGETE